MQAVLYERYGGPEVLKPGFIDRPEPKPDELLVRVQAVEATKTDCEMRSFDQAVKWFWVPLRLLLGIFRPRSPVLGMYFAGEVVTIGADVDRFTIGDAIYGSTGLGRGAYAEYVTVSAKAPVALKPTTMTFAQAAAVPLGAVNAVHFMELADIEPGDRVLVNGAGGVIGAYAVQVARSMGADVTGVDAGHKEAFVRSMGASEFIDYQTSDVAAAAERSDAKFDVVFDMVPSTSVRRMLKLLGPGGRYVNGNPRLATMLRAPFVTRFTDKTMLIRFAAETGDFLARIASMIDAGRLGPIVDRVLPLAEAAQGHRLVDSEQRIGAIVLAVGERANER